MAEGKALTKEEYLRWRGIGTVPTMPDALVETLLERGIDPQDFALQVSGGFAFEGVDPPDNYQELAKLDADFGGGGVPGSEQGEEAADSVVQKAIEEAQQTGQISEETQAELQTTGAAQEIQAAIAAIAGGASQAPWVLAELGGVDPDNIDLAAMFDMAVSLFPDMQWMDRVEGLTDEQYKVSAMARMLQSQNAKTSTIVRAYAEDNNLHASQVQDGGFKVQELTDAADRHGVTYREAKLLALAGSHTGMSVDESVAAFKWAKDTGIKMRDLPTPRTRYQIGGGPYPGYTTTSTVTPSMEETSGYADGGPYPGYYSSEGGKYEIVPTAGEVQRMYNTAKKKYGSDAVARVAMHSPELAERLYDDPYSLSIEELRKVDEYIGGYNSIAGTDPGAANWIADRLLGSTPNTVTVNKDGVREAARVIAASWNMPGLSNAQLDAIVSRVVAPQIEAAKQALGNPFNPKFNDGTRVINSPDAASATANLLRGTPQYQELFGNLRDGETEEAYAGRFSQESQQLLGDNNLDVARAGMRTGDRNTVGRNVLMTGAGEDSSTFQQRLSRLGSAFRSMT